MYLYLCICICKCVFLSRILNGNKHSKVSKCVLVTKCLSKLCVLSVRLIVKTNRKIFLLFIFLTQLFLCAWSGTDAINFSENFSPKKILTGNAQKALSRMAMR